MLTLPNGHEGEQQRFAGKGLDDKSAEGFAPAWNMPVHPLSPLKTPSPEFIVGCDVLGIAGGHGDT